MPVKNSWILVTEAHGWLEQGASVAGLVKKRAKRLNPLFKVYLASSEVTLISVCA